MSGHIKNVSVFLGSRVGADPRYTEIAKNVGNLLAKHGYSLVYGGGTSGCMGLLAEEFSKASGSGFAVNITRFGHQGDTPAGFKEIVAKDMFARKRTLVSMSDAHVILPGGWGTLDEMFAAAVEEDTKKHDDPDAPVKPIIFFNAPIGGGKGYFDGALAQIQVVMEEGFANEHSGRFYTSVSSEEELVDMLARLNDQGPVPTGVERTHILSPDGSIA